MWDLFRDAFFGRMVNLVSGGRLFSVEGRLDSSTLEKYSKSTSSPSSDVDESATDVDQRKGEGGVAVDQELGKDSALVDWVENDPEV
jgi:hypothetical protein